jgi:hypothetical protein
VLTGPRSSIGSPTTLRMRPSVIGPTGHGDLRARVGHALAAGEALRRVHRDRADRVLAEMLRDLEDRAATRILRLERDRIGGSLSSKVTSTTAPMTCETRPTLLEVNAVAIGFFPCLLVRHPRQRPGCRMPAV